MILGAQQETSLRHLIQTFLTLTITLETSCFEHCPIPELIFIVITATVSLQRASVCKLNPDFNYVPMEPGVHTTTIK